MKEADIIDVWMDDDAWSTLSPTMKLRNLVDCDSLTLNQVHLTAFEDPHIHLEHDEVVWFLKGDGRFRLGERVFPIAAGQMVFVPAGLVHTPIVVQSALVVSVFGPRYDLERPDRVSVAG